MTYEFRRLEAADLPLIDRWLEMPDVREWWGIPPEQSLLISGDLRDGGMEQFIVSLDGRPFAYIQCYLLSHWPQAAFDTQPEGARGIDQFIGEADMIGCGHGSAFIRQFVDRLLAAGAPCAVTDPDPRNARAIRAYEKAGFEQQRLIDTSDGQALLMVRSLASDVAPAARHA